MPLPPALAARLKKRGLLKEEKLNNENTEEEVFVEHYDEPSKDDNTHKVEEKTSLLIYESVNCPNKCNPYHDCVDWCAVQWGLKHFKEDPNLRPKRQRMLGRYPLPDGWDEVGDPESGRFYYWNMATGEVSWLPPTHPRSHVTMPAERPKPAKPQRGKSLSSESEHESEDEREERRRRRRRRRRSRSHSQSKSEGSGVEEQEDDPEMKEMTMEEFDEVERRLLQEAHMREKEREEAKRKKKRNDLDPMDPASYSDIPRGNWSSGLETHDKALTGVDETAAGPLFQMRPYPSPGAVLRLNQQNKKKK